MNDHMGGKSRLDMAAASFCASSLLIWLRAICMYWDEKKVTRVASSIGFAVPREKERCGTGTVLTY